MSDRNGESSQNSTALLPCPFCGGPAEPLGYILPPAAVTCGNYDCPLQGKFSVDAWNARPERCAEREACAKEIASVLPDWTADFYNAEWIESLRDFYIRRIRARTT